MSRVETTVKVTDQGKYIQVQFFYDGGMSIVYLTRDEAKSLQDEITAILRKGE